MIQKNPVTLICRSICATEMYKSFSFKLIVSTVGLKASVGLLLQKTIFVLLYFIVLCLMDYNNKKNTQYNSVVVLHQAQ